MNSDFFGAFLRSSDTLQVYEGDHLVFSSQKERLLPLFEYIVRFAPYHRNVAIFDKVMGNAAALLSIKAGSQEVYSPLGSQLAAETLDRYGIRYHLAKVVPYIQAVSKKAMCPMEKLSIGKGPAEFCGLLRGKLGTERGSKAEWKL